MTYQPSEKEEFSIKSRRVLENMKSVAEKSGWDFYIEPEKSIVPEFLGKYRPDALAFKNDKGMVIEVTNRKNLEHKGLLSEISKLVSAQPGWTFRVVYAGASGSDDTDFNLPQRDEIISALHETQVLNENGHERAALLIGWATLEAVTQVLSSNIGSNTNRNMDPRQVIYYLVQDGYLEDKDALYLRRISELRNQIIHGGLGVKVRSKDVEILMRYINNIMNYMHG